MIYPLSQKSGVVVQFFLNEDSEEMYEFKENYLSEGAGDPELIFSGLSFKDLQERFDTMFQLCWNLNSHLKERKF